MIVLNLKDGLGNQFFEMAFVEKLSEFYPNEKIYINPFFFQNGKRRFPSLQHFKVSESITFMNKAQTNAYTLLFVLRIAFRHPVIFFKWLTSKQRPKDAETFARMSKNGLYLTFNTFGYMPVNKCKRKIKFIYGNFENHNYFTGLDDVLKEKFQCIEQMKDSSKEVCEHIENSESVCVHIRRGDYLDPRWAMLNVCNFDYYANAMESAYTKDPKVKFFVFSNTHNDIEWIKENYKFDPKYQIEYVDLGNSDYEELELMKRCKHFIISNSTYSWWATYLSDNQNKMVFAPERWTTDENDDCSGMYYSEWTKI